MIQLFKAWFDRRGFRDWRWRLRRAEEARETARRETEQDQLMAAVQARQNLRLLSPLVASAAPLGLNPVQSAKYTTDGHSLINRYTGEPIPPDEPVLILRAKDPYTLATAVYYMALVDEPGHQASMSRLVQQLMDYAQHHERKRRPDTPLS